MEPYQAEGLLNTLVQQEGYEFLQKLKDRWPTVSKKIKDTFGTPAVALTKDGPYMKAWEKMGAPEDEYYLIIWPLPCATSGN